MEIEEVIEVLNSRGVGILPTDTLYGLVGQALDPNTVKRINRLKNRPENKPFIVLISSISDLEKFSIDLNSKVKKELKSLWPNQISVILPVKDQTLSYLTKGLNSLAFRLPKDKFLLDILNKTGPLVAPSANIASEKPAETIEEAERYFGNSVDFYYDAGRRTSSPSTIVSLIGDELEILRRGDVEIK